MHYRKLGNTDILVSAEGYGCMGLSEFYGPTSESKAEEIIHKAIELGITFFDTADIYGSGHNEKLLGRILLNYNQTQIVVATKCGIVRDPDNPTHREINNDEDYILSCFEKSSARLGRAVDLFYLHRVIQEENSIKRAMKAMNTLLETGQIKAVGLSEVSAQTIALADKCLQSYSQGKHGLTAVQMEYSLFSRDIEFNGVLDICQKLGITIVAYSPVSRGLLTGKLKSLDNLANDDSRRYLPRFMDNNLAQNNALVQSLITISNAIGCTPAQMALAWIMNKKQNIVPIPGTRTIEYLRENALACELRLSNEQMAEIQDILDKHEIAGERYPADFMKAYGMTN